MKKLLVGLVMAGMLIGVSGCSTALSRAKFQGHTICSGQSADSVEKRLGDPDRVASCRYDWFWGYVWTPSSKAMACDPRATISTAEIIGGNISEWMYLGGRQSNLIMWLKSGVVDRIWIGCPK